MGALALPMVCFIGVVVVVGDWSAVAPALVFCPHHLMNRRMVSIATPPQACTHLSLMKDSGPCGYAFFLKYSRPRGYVCCAAALCILFVAFSFRGGYAGQVVVVLVVAITIVLIVTIAVFPSFAVPSSTV